MIHSFENGILTVFLSGRLDSHAAPPVQAEINALLDKTGAEAVVIDLEELRYVASAGLRVFLQLKKRKNDLTITNVPTEIYDVFEMTGFSEIMTVKKAYRRVPAEICEVIGRGANGIIYRVNPEIIVKAYKQTSTPEDIAREQELARRAFVLGIPTAISYDIVRIGDSYGAAYELLDAQSVAQMLAADPGRLDECAALMAELLKIIHATTAQKGEMPSAKGTLLDYVGSVSGFLDAQTARRLTELVSALPDTAQVLHGDYHIKNVMVQGGEALLIDMDTLCCGHPVIELGYMYNAYCGFVELDEQEGTEFIGMDAETSRRFWRKQMSFYFASQDEAFLDGIEKKARIAGYVRLLRYVLRKQGADTEKGAKQAEFLKNRLKELVNETDSLTW